MRRKDKTIQTEFHPILTAFLFEVNELYRVWGDEVIITCGSEPTVKHIYTSLHYATPCQAADIRSWSKRMGRADVPIERIQHETLVSLVISFCKSVGIPSNWIEVRLTKTHIHIEYQPKRQENLINS